MRSTFRNRINARILFSLTAACLLLSQFAGVRTDSTSNAAGRYREAASRTDTDRPASQSYHHYYKTASYHHYYSRVANVAVANADA